MTNHLILERFAWCPEGTFGRLKFPTGEEVFTCEKPWLNNKAFVSCIPVGVYYLEQRHSPVVSRTSGGKFSEGWEVTGVRDRDYIMIHPGNWPEDVQGCIAVGNDFRVSQNRKGRWVNSVMSSRDAFKEVMALMASHNEWTLDIRTFFPVSF